MNHTLNMKSRFDIINLAKKFSQCIKLLLKMRNLKFSLANFYFVSKNHNSTDGISDVYSSLGNSTQILDFLYGNVRIKLA